MAKILMVDDSPDILLVLRATFENAGHDVIATENPKEVLGLVNEHQPEAMVLDVMMPGVTGWDVLRELRQQPQHEAIPVVMLSALSDVSDRIKGLRGGADDYQVKPFDPDELLARVEVLLNRKTISASQAVPVATPDRLPLAEAIRKLERHFMHQEQLDDVSLGRYEVVDLLGSGAMGTVFRGWDPKLQRSVALKTIRFDADHLDRKVQVHRLLEEAVANARLQHQNIVTVYDYGDEDNAAFIAMELVEGTTLEGYLTDHNRVPAHRLIPLAAAMARGLAVAHANDLVHRDVKPGNVLLGFDSCIKVTDFGISEFISKASRPETIFGTPGYLAPECLEGGKATEQSDLFALGVVLYEAATGKHPFIEKTWRKTLHRTMTFEPPALGKIVPEVPRGAAEVIAHLLQKREADRPENAQQVADAFEDIAAEQTMTWSLDNEEAPPTRPRRRRESTRSQHLPLHSFSLQPA